MNPRLPSRCFRGSLAWFSHLPLKPHCLHISDHNSARGLGRWYICTCGEKERRWMKVSPCLSTALFLCSVLYRTTPHCFLYPVHKARQKFQTFLLRNKNVDMNFSSVKWDSIRLPEELISCSFQKEYVFLL